MGTSDGSSSSSASGTFTARGGFRRGASGFDSQFNAYLHRRLRLCASVLLVSMLALAANLFLTHILSGRARELGLFDASRTTALASRAASRIRGRTSSIGSGTDFMAMMIPSSTASTRFPEAE